MIPVCESRKMLFDLHTACTISLSGCVQLYEACRGRRNERLSLLKPLRDVSMKKPSDCFNAYRASILQLLLYREGGTGSDIPSSYDWRRE